MPENKPCSVHFVNNCPLCTNGFGGVAILATEPPIDEVQQVIAKQKSAVADMPESQREVTPPIVSIQDPHAHKVLNAAENYAIACEHLKKLDAEIYALTAALDSAQIELEKAKQVREEAKKILLETI